MAKKNLGVAPSLSSHTATKGYVDSLSGESGGAIYLPQEVYTTPTDPVIGKANWYNMDETGNIILDLPALSTLEDGDIMKIGRMDADDYVLAFQCAGADTFESGQILLFLFMVGEEITLGVQNGKWVTLSNYVPDTGIEQFFTMALSLTTQDNIGDGEDYVRLSVADKEKLDELEPLPDRLAAMNAATITSGSAVKFLGTNDQGATWTATSTFSFGRSLMGTADAAGAATLLTSNVTLTGAETLTNKTLTQPRIDYIRDTNGAVALMMTPAASAVNYLNVSNQALGSSPAVSAAGTDTNIDVGVVPKGTGTLSIYVSSGNTPTVRANGQDTNHNLNLVTKGTGVVQANGVAVVTLSGAQTLTNKTLTSPSISSPSFSGTPTGLTKSHVGLGNVDNTSDANKPVSTATQTALDLKAPLASPTFTGTVSGVTKAHVGLGNVDNTSDANKPVSTATQTALDLKANLASPTFTGTVSGITKSMVGLGNVDNTSDANKPVSTATQTALDGKANTSHTHSIASVTDLQDNLDSLDDEINTAPRILIFNGTTWPDRPEDSRTTFFIGGEAPANAPADLDLIVGDMWFPVE